MQVMMSESSCQSCIFFNFTQDLWSGVLHHVNGEHEWALGACQHGSLPEDRDKTWIKKGFEAH